MAALARAAALASAVSSFPAAPLFKQCDPAWANVPMGTKGNGEDSTICGEGCAMTSLSMALFAFGALIPIAGSTQPSNPATFNSWLEANAGYVCLDGDCNNLVLNAVSRLNASWTLGGELPVTQLPLAALEAGLDGSPATVYLAHVRDQGHFVLLTGYIGAGSGNFTVNDPYYNSSTYAYGDIHDVIVYNVAA